uniref:EGF-like domain-containing protein n=1 Tax=Ditylenchus dipsaci TaxID=166011 RepID=A0A915D744_9BILA
MVNHAELVKNFTYHLFSYVIDEQVGAGTSEDEGGNSATTLNCRVFHGSYYIPPPTIFNLEQFNYAIQVVCKCPEVGPNSHVLDRNCRRLPTCKNNGFRSLIDPRKCLCIQPFFGYHCEKFCDQGQRIRGLNGRDYCSCSAYYKGLECREMVCLNGGHEDNGRCICPSQFLGYHCEIDTNRTGHSVEYPSNGHGPNSRFQRFGDQNNEMFTRDISGTIFSLIMIVVLVVSMYLLMKHRMQVQTRYLSRRPDLLGACNFPVIPPTNAGLSARRVELVPTMESDSRSFPFRSIISTMVGDGGPPPYIPPGHRGRRGRDDSLPPLPSYEDATKLPPLRPNLTEGEEEEVENSIPPDTLNVQDTRPEPNAEDAAATNRSTAQSSSSSSANGTPVHAANSRLHNPPLELRQQDSVEGAATESLTIDPAGGVQGETTQLSSMSPRNSRSARRRTQESTKEMPETEELNEEEGNRHTSL